MAWPVVNLLESRASGRGGKPRRVSSRFPTQERGHHGTFAGLVLPSAGGEGPGPPRPCWDVPREVTASSPLIQESAHLKFRAWAWEAHDWLKVTQRVSSSQGWNSEFQLPARYAFHSG